MNPPPSLIEAIRFFEDEDTAIAFVAAMRWPDGEQVCPKCGSVGEHYFLKNQHRWKCRDCRKQFSIKVGTIFEDSPLPLSKWLPAVWMLSNCKNGISSYELARALDVSQKTAWFMLHRIREAMREGPFDPFSGEVEADETYIGGISKNMHKAKRERVIKSRGASDKAAVVGVLGRDPDGGSKVRTRVVRTVDRETVQGYIRETVAPGSVLFTDGHQGYVGLGEEYLHDVVDHAREYVRGRVHTNGLENFWSLFKRAVKGTYVAIDPFHLSRYLDEQTFRFNARKDNDAGRFLWVLSALVGKRLTWTALTGQALSPS